MDRPSITLLVLTATLATLAACGVVGETSELTSESACSALKQRVGRHDAVPPTLLDKTWFCDVAADDAGHYPDWWIIALRSFRECEGICSNLRGWYAINRHSGEVREFNVAEMVVAGPILEP